MPHADSGITLAEAWAVLRAYDVGRLLFTRPGAGTANPAIVAVTPRGEFFLKRRNPRYSGRGQLQFDHAVIRHLARSGLPVNPPVRTTSGSRWQEQDGRIYELYPLVRGDGHTPGNLAQVAAAGEALGAFHAATQDLTPGGEKPVGRLHDPRDILRGLHWARDELATGRTSAHGDLPLVQRLIETTQAIRRELPDPAYWSLPLCIIHGDYHPANLKFDGDRVAGIFDFDWVSRQPRMVDLADGLIFFCGVRERPLQAGDIVSLTQPFRLDQGAVEAFGGGYGSAIAVTDAELAALASLLRARWLFCRVDAMERKLPPDRKLDYLLEGIELPLAGIDECEQYLRQGRWVRP